MLAVIDKLEAKLAELSDQLASPEVINDLKKLRKISKQHRDVSEILEVGRRYRKISRQLEDNEQICRDDSDKELAELARSELDDLYTEMESVEKELKLLLIPRDPNDSKNTVMEIRAGTGGDEAALFAADMYRMYTRFADAMGWRTDILSSHPTGVGGFKEIIVLVVGDGAYGKLKYESGVHRVQRVPVTESSGRIHTSAASVAVLPEAEEIDIAINPNELKIDVFRSSGPGGQSVNTTDSAVRITHIPTGMVVTCQDEKSQLKNKNKAMKVLRTRLLEQAEEKQHGEIADQRKSMVSTGDRSAKIRTYNFPQGRVTDHRIGLTIHQLDNILQGDLNQIIEALSLADQQEKLKLTEKEATVVGGE
ncbi:MAG: peptide chain release factor 1 [candidate division Zixibacteria bacterium]|nr:peptide chain release factor 1 [candidate division Zixibacteria bacterium]